MRFLRKISQLLVVVALSMAVVTEASGQDTRSQENKIAKLEREIQILNEQIASNSTKSNSALGSLSLIRSKIAAQNELLRESDREIKVINDSIVLKQEQIKQMQERLDTLSAYYAKLVRGAYKNRDNKVWYMYVLSSRNMGQAFRRVGYLRGLSARMNQQARKIGEVKDELEKENEALLSLQTKAKSRKAEREKVAASLRSEEANAKGVVSSLQKDRKKYEKQIAQKRRQVEALNKEIERLIREATKQKETAKDAKGTGDVTDRTKVDYALDAEFAKNKGKLPWPANGPVVEQFGQHYHPVYKNVKLPFSNGISMALPSGSSVKAVFDGEVKQIVVMPGYNKCVLVRHGTYFSFYCKLGDVSVKAGDKVKTGDILGTVDTIDGQTQLHFQIWKGTTPQNPILWLRN